MDLNLRAKAIIKLREEYPGENLTGLVLGKDFLDRTQKSMSQKKEKMGKLDFIKLQILLFKRHF